VNSTGRRNTSNLEVFMGRPAGWMKALTGRSLMKSPGAPCHRREVERQFWRQIAKGVLAEEAANAVGVSQAVGARWFRHRGGMPIDLSPSTGRFLSFHEREEIAISKAQGLGVREVARRLGRDPSTISREVRRNAATRGGKLEYRASVAQWKAELVAQRPKTAKLVANERLREYVQERLAGQVRRPNGTPVQGPATTAWKGRNKPHRGDRRWVNAWSPEQIANRLEVDFPKDRTMRISHEAIYQALYVEGRGALKRELVTCLRTGRALRIPRARTNRKSWAHVTPEVMISERPAEAEDRAVPGHWEGDLLIGLERSAIGTLVERTTRFTMLIHLPREEGYRHKHTIKNGPALAGYGAVTMKNALAESMVNLPDQLRRSLTWDRGKELSQHAAFRVETGIPVYFADPHSPWQRGSNENTNGLLRQYFAKGTDLSRWNAEEIEAVATTLNSRPRKALGWKTPAEAFHEHLLLIERAGVASTD
jgi:IS30 family transposase